MSVDNVKKLFGKMEKDVELQKKYFSMAPGNQKETEKMLSDRLVEFGKMLGFDFSKDDLLAARAELMDRVNSNRELADDDLAKVAGGASDYKQSMAAMSAASLGFLCAIVSIMSEGTRQGSCGRKMSTTEQC